MLENAVYVNSIGEKIEFGKPPYFLNYNDLRNYRWQYASVNNKVTSFFKGITEKPFPVQIVVPADADADAVKNRIYEVFEYDVRNNIRGKLYVGDYYIKCNIIESKKSAYLESEKAAKMDFVLVTDSEDWIRESKEGFIKSELVDVVDFTVYGKTQKYISVAENGTLVMSATRKNGEVASANIRTLPLCSYDDDSDVLYKKPDGAWCVEKRSEVISVDLSKAELLIDSVSDTDYKTYKIELQREASDEYSCNVLADHVSEITFDENIGYKEGYAIESTGIQGASQKTNVFLEICGTAEGVQNFTLRCVTSNWNNNNDYYADYTNEELSAYTNYELRYGINLTSDKQKEIGFALDMPLYEGESIRCINGKWNIFKHVGVFELSPTLANELNNLVTYYGFTAIYTVGDSPFLKAYFKSEEWRNNRVSNKEILNLPLKEFVQVYGNYAYIRVRETTTGIKLHYKYKEVYAYELDADAQAFFARVEGYDDVKQIIVNDPLIDNDFGSSDYPRGYNWGYYNPKTKSETINNESFMASAFRLIIYGKCHEPEIIINNHTYKIMDTIERDEYVIVDSAEKTITKYCGSRTENIFHKRYKEQSIFEPIAAGANDISWNREFSFDLILMDERSEPRWT